MIQQRAGEWLLKQLNQMTDTEKDSITVSKEKIFNPEGEDKVAMKLFKI